LVEGAHDAIIAVVIIGREGQGIGKAVIGHGILGHRPEHAADLGRDHIAIARLAIEKIAEAKLGQAVAVARRGIEIADAGVPGDLQRGRRLVAGDGLVEIADARAAEGIFGDLDAGAADLACLHDAS
jgi:hypothetical protein